LEQIYKIFSFLIIRFKLTVDESHNPETAWSKSFYWFWCYPPKHYVFKSFEKLWRVNIFSPIELASSSFW